MSEMLIQLGLLAVAIICNILCGIYYNINIKEANFDWYKLVNGVLKAIVISAVAIGMAFVFENKPELSEAVGVTPNFVINSAIILYVSKVLVGLGKILGIKVDIKGDESND